MFTALIINDDPADGATVRNALADAGCLDIATVSAGESSSVLAADGRAPDVIVVHAGPRDAALLTRLARGYRDIPIIAICHETLIEGAFRAGADDGITTPVRRAELVARLRSALRVRAETGRRRSRERRLSEAVDKLQREKHQLERLVCVDPLTGVANRRHALSLLEAEWRRSARDRSSLAVVMVDLDCYHAFNEHYGHLGGDACLHRVCEAMVTCLRRPSDFLGRYGGEEFLVVLPGTDAAGAKIVAERLRAAVEALAIPHAGSTCSPFVTITAGFAAVHAQGERAAQVVIGAADAALLRAKLDGRNRIGGDAPPTQPSRISAQRWERFPPVLTDPWFADRIPVFLADTRADAEGIDDALRAGKLDRIRTVARRLKSAALAFALPEIQRLGEELEHGAKAQDHAAIRAIAEELVQYVTHVQVVYRRPLEAPDALQAI